MELSRDPKCDSSLVKDFTHVLTFFLYIYDIQFTKENKIYNHQVHWKYIYLGGEKVKTKKRIRNAINNIKKY